MPLPHPSFQNASLAFTPPTFQPIHPYQSNQWPGSPNFNKSQHFGRCSKPSVAYEFKPATWSSFHSAGNVHQPLPGSACSILPVWSAWSLSPAPGTISSSSPACASHRLPARIAQSSILGGSAWWPSPFPAGSSWRLSPTESSC